MRDSGLTLIGVLVALFLLATTVIAVAPLAARTLQLARLSRATLTATQLAREGLELTRATRDANWFKRDPWASQLCPGTDPTVTLALDGDLLPVYGPSDSQQQLYVGDHGLMSHVPSGSPTTFRRLLTVDCQAVESPESRVIVVTAAVSWEDRGQHTVTLSEKLYDWYQAPPGA